MTRKQLNWKCTRWFFTALFATLMLGVLSGCAGNPASEQILSTARAQAHVTAAQQMCTEETLACSGALDTEGWSVTSTSKF